MCFCWGESKTSIEENLDKPGDTTTRIERTSTLNKDCVIEDEPKNKHKENAASENELEAVSIETSKNPDHESDGHIGVRLNAFPDKSEETKEEYLLKNNDNFNKEEEEEEEENLYIFTKGWLQLQVLNDLEAFVDIMEELESNHFPFVRI